MNYIMLVIGLIACYGAFYNARKAKARKSEIKQLRKAIRRLRGEQND